MNEPMDANGYLLSRSFIPYEVLTVILGYVLPHKSIIQCRLVCKIWKEIIEKESWRFVVKLKKNQPEPYTDAEVEKISKLPWFMLHFMCAENSLFGQNFAKTKVNAGTHVWKLLNPDSSDWLTGFDHEHPDEIKNCENLCRSEWSYYWSRCCEDYYDYGPMEEERIIEFPKCGLSSLILREFMPKITVSFWTGVFDEQSENSIKLSLRNSANEELGADVYENFYRAARYNMMGRWTKVTLEAQVTETNSDLNCAIVSHALRRGSFYEFMCFLVHIGKPDILAVDWDDIVKRYQDEEKSESFASVLSADYPLHMSREINSRGTFSPNLLPNLHWRRRCLELFTFPKSGILKPGIWYGRAFPDILKIKNLAEDDEDVNELCYENGGDYVILYELSSQISLRECGLFGFLMDEFQPRIEAYIDKSQKKLNLPTDETEMKYEMTVSLLDNEGKILHQKQGSEMLPGPITSKKLLLTFENYGKGVTYIKYSIRRHVSMTGEAIDYYYSSFNRYIETVVDESNVQVLLP